MDFVVSATDPWGRPVLTSVSWQALWVSVFIGITFLLAHAAYMVLSVNQKQSESNLDWKLNIQPYQTRLLATH